MLPVQLYYSEYQITKWPEECYPGCATEYNEADGCTMLYGKLSPDIVQTIDLSLRHIHSMK